MQLIHSRISRFGFVLFFAALVAFVSACATPTPTPAPAPSAPASAPAATTAAAAPTAAPATSAAPAATATSANAPKRGGKVVIALWQSPATLNGFLNTGQPMEETLVFVVEGLLQTMPDGTYGPVLAKEVPTTQNGGVSADGKTITYNLKPGLLWSDGSAVTCDDVKFTWQAVMTPNSGVTSTTGYSDIDTVECPNPATAVVKYKNFFAPYLRLFDRILPKSAGDPKDMKNWAYNRKPLGTGPYKIDEWVVDDHVTLSRNDKYRDAAQGKPYLDQIILRIVASTDVALQLLNSGEVDVMWKPTEDMIPQLDKMTGVKYTTPARPGGERLFLEMAENKNPSDPTKPHMILGDVKVRLAIGYGIDRQRIVNGLYSGKVPLGTTELTSGFFNCSDKIKGYPFDPEKAKQLLTEAGWVPGTDGIRIAKGAKYAPDGTRLRLKITTTSGDKARESAEVLMVEDMKKIGVEFFIENAPSAVVVSGTWEQDAPRRRGNFDIIQYGPTPGNDPHERMVEYWASWMIPTEQNKNGTNMTRFSDPQADAWLKQAAGEPDIAKRRDLYCQVLQKTYDQANMIFLYTQTRMHAYRERLQGWVPSSWSALGWNAADWWVNK
jgi:peptide/nickel transport system substrate-binding protein